MEKVKFTPLGVQQLLAQLYALPVANLQKEIEALEADFRKWVLEHFALTEQQTVDLDNMDESFAELLTSELAESLSLNEPVSLIKKTKMMKVLVSCTT